MSGTITKQDLQIIDGKLATQKTEILDKVSDTLKHFEDRIDIKFDRVNFAVEELIKVASEAKGLASKTYYAIEGNGAIGIKTQVRTNYKNIKKLAEKFECEEKEELIEKLNETKNKNKIKIEDKKNNKGLLVAVIIAVITSSASLITAVGSLENNNNNNNKSAKELAKEIIIEIGDINEISK